MCDNFKWLYFLKIFSYVLPHGFFCFISLRYKTLHFFLYSRGHYIQYLIITCGGGGVIAKLCPTLTTLWSVACQAPPCVGFPRQEYWSGLPFLLQGIFPAQGLNPGLLHCRRILYWLSHQGSKKTESLCYTLETSIYSKSATLRLKKNKKNSPFLFLWKSEVQVALHLCHSLFILMSDSLQPHGLYSRWNSPGQNTGMGSLFLLHGIFPTQGSNPGLPHCRRILCHLSHKGSRRILGSG